MDAAAAQACTVFTGMQHLTAGPVHGVAWAVKIHVDIHPESRVPVLDNATAQPVEFNLCGTVEDVLAHLDRATLSTTQSVKPEGRPRGPGRLKLNVIAREVTLLPRHWDWLAA